MVLGVMVAMVLVRVVVAMDVVRVMCGDMVGG
jgi:hypothetical protein